MTLRTFSAATFLLFSLFLSQALCYLPQKDTLHVGQELLQDGKLVSSDGSYVFTVQNDGYLVILRYGMQNIWMSPTPFCAGHGSLKLVLQPDGDLVFIGGKNSHLWSTNTKGGKRLTIQKDGNLVLFDEEGKEIWTSGTGGLVPTRSRENSNEDTPVASVMDTLGAGEILTQGGILQSRNELYKAIIQPDGNFVVYYKAKNEASAATWDTGTFRKGGKQPFRLAMQLDGDLVIYDADNRALWTKKNTSKGSTGNYLVMENHGRLVVYDSNKRQVWSSGGRYDEYL